MTITTFTFVVGRRISTSGTPSLSFSIDMQTSTRRTIRRFRLSITRFGQREAAPRYTG
jgi:hypothetical protein